MARKIWDEDIESYNQDWGGDSSTENLDKFSYLAWSTNDINCE